MRIVARQQDYFAGPDNEALSTLTFDSNTKLAFDDIVINDQVGRRPKGRRAMLGRDARRHAPRREEVGVQEHAAGQMRHSQDVGQRVHTRLHIRMRCFGHVCRRASHRPSIVLRTLLIVDSAGGILSARQGRRRRSMRDVATAKTR